MFCEREGELLFLLLIERLARVIDGPCLREATARAAQLRTSPSPWGDRVRVCVPAGALVVCTIAPSRSWGLCRAGCACIGAYTRFCGAQIVVAFTRRRAFAHQGTRLSLASALLASAAAQCLLRCLCPSDENVFSGPLRSTMRRCKAVLPRRVFFSSVSAPISSRSLVYTW